MQAAAKATHEDATRGKSRGGPTSRRSTIPLLVLGIVVSLFVGAGLPPLVLNIFKPLPVGAYLTYHTKPDEALLMSLDPSWSKAARPYSNDPACDPLHELGDEVSRAEYRKKAAQVPLYCSVSTGLVELDQVLTTSKGKNREEMYADTTVVMSFNGRPIAELTDHVLVDRGSALPVPGSMQRNKLKVPALHNGVTTEHIAPTGLSYFFPFNTERRSYNYVDFFASAEQPIDYVDTVNIGDLQAYEFKHHIPPVRADDDYSPLQQLATGTPDSPTLLSETSTGPARFFYSEEELKAKGLDPDEQVTMYPYLSVVRSAFVQPDTGHLLDLHEEHYAFLASDDTEANEMAQTTSNSNANRTLLHFRADWDEATKQEKYKGTAAEVRQLRLLQILAWVGKAMAVILIAVLAWIIVRYRRRLATQ